MEYRFATWTLGIELTILLNNATVTTSPHSHINLEWFSVLGLKIELRISTKVIPECLEGSLNAIEGLCVENGFEQRRSEQNPSDLVSVDEIAQRCWIIDHIVRDYIHRDPFEYRSKQLPHEKHIASNAIIGPKWIVDMAPMIGEHGATMRTEDAYNSSLQQSAQIKNKSTVPFGCPVVPDE